MNLSWCLERAVWEFRDNVAVVDADGTATTYQQLRAESNRIGNALATMGIVSDDVVVSAMPDDHVHVGLFYATLRLGAAFSGLNYRLEPRRILADVARCGAKLAVVHPAQLALGQRLAEQPSIRHVLVTGGPQTEFLSLDDAVRDQSAELRIADRSMADLAAINFTSGTSGASKAVMFTHGTLGNSALGAICLGGVNSRSRNVSLVSCAVSSLDKS